MRLPRLPRHNRGTWTFAGVAVVIAILVAGYAVHELSKPKDTLNRTAAFVNTQTSAKAPPPASTFLWPIYGYTPQRNRDFSAATDLNPPFQKAWTLGGNALLEFPPVIWGNNLYYIDDGATVKRVNIKTGKLIWEHHMGEREGSGAYAGLSASTPALDVQRKLLFVTVLSTTSTAKGSADGAIAALSLTSGKVVWEHSVPSGSESSPIVIGNSVYFGDQAGTLTSLDVDSGHTNWTFGTGGAIKAGPAYYDGNLYFGNYAGTFYAVGAKSGKPVWDKSVGGTMYSTPAIDFGRVYVGDTNGAVYSFVAKTGEVAWSRSTGNYVYSAPAVANIKGLGPTVYIGSYNGDLYALNAEDGTPRWAYPVGKAISGSATVIDNTVYFSTVYEKGSYGLNAVTGKKVFYYPDGSYTTVVADPDAVFLMGKYVIYKLVPKA